MEYPIEIEVIFVDDDREICHLMEEYFNRLGLRYFKIFSDVHEAVEYCLSQDLGIAIFIVDYNLAGQTGLFFLDQVRSKFPNAYLDAIILSGHCGAHFCALHKAQVEIPSDIHGVLYIPMDKSEGWKMRRAKEMKKTGMPVELSL